MRILLIPPKSNYPQRTPSFDHVGQALPYLAAALEASGHDVVGCNVSYRWCDDGAPATLSRLLKAAMMEARPDAVGVGGLSADYLFVRDAIDVIRSVSPDTPIISGGGLVSSDPDHVVPHLRPDYAVIGEGEQTIIELLNCLATAGDLDSVHGIVYWKDGRPVFTPARTPVDDLDMIPFPDYSLFDFETYLNLLNQYDGYFHCRTRRTPRIMPVSAARSCPFRCTFCYHTTGAKYRVRSIDKVVEEILHFHELYQFFFRGRGFIFSGFHRQARGG